jgi:virulence-associated protein VagC
VSRTPFFSRPYILRGYTLFVPPKQTIVFKTGNSSAVRLLGDCKLPRGTRVREYREGDRIILEPLGGWPASFLDSLGAYPDEIPRPSDDTSQRDPFSRR